MIKFENTEVIGWEAAIRGMRNPMNSWEKSDSEKGCSVDFVDRTCKTCEKLLACNMPFRKFVIGPNDLDLMKRLQNAGTDHRKFMRMIAVYVDITAPLYWWKEFDTYKVGTVANSCSTMHKLAAKEFSRDDFSWEHLTGDNYVPDHEYQSSTYILDRVIESLNFWRHEYLTGEEFGIKKDKRAWWQMIQLIPSSYNQRRTVMLNYEVLANIYKSRKNHKLDEWREHEPVNITNGEEVVRTIPNQYQGFCDWIKTLPYSELITGEFNVAKKEEKLEKSNSVLTPNEYQKQAARTMDKTLTPNGQLEEGLMGLNGEAGECLEILKKHLFQNQTLNKEHLAEELGDVAWYLAESAYAIDYDLETILKMNLRKLEERYPVKTKEGGVESC